MSRSDWEVVIGLEVHAQLDTASKIFSGASTAFGAEPNRQASAVDIALPGVLPVLNRGAVERAIVHERRERSRWRGKPVDREVVGDLVEVDRDGGEAHGRHRRARTGVVPGVSRSALKRARTK